MANERYSLFPASFTYAGPTTMNLLQMLRDEVRPEVTRDVVIPAGGLDAGAVIISHAEPKARLQTSDLTTFFGAVSASAGLGGITAAAFRRQRRADGGTFAGGSTNVTVTATKGFLYPDSISAEQDNPQGAVLEAIFAALYDGTNAPLVANTGQALSLTPTFTSKFYLGPVYVNGVQVDGVMSSRVQFGIDFQYGPMNGDVYPRVGSIVARRPVLSFTTKYVDQIATAALFGAAPAGTVAFYYWKGVSGGTRVAVASTVHCKLSVASGEWDSEDVSVQEHDDGTATITITPTATLAAAVASAIP